MSKKFDDIIKNKLQKAEIAPSAGLWAKIEKGLDNKNNKALIIPFWQGIIFKQAMAASVIFLLGGITINYFLTNNSPSKTEISKTNAKKTNSKKAFDKKGSIKNEIKSESFANNKKSKTSTINNSNVNSFKNNLPNKGNVLFSNNISLKTKKENTSVSDYVWIYDKETKGYIVVLKEKSAVDNNYFISETELPKMSLTIEEQKKEDSPEILSIPEIDDSYKEFRRKVPKLNYKGFWLGPNIGFQSVLVAENFYPGGTFGVDFGYDFGGSIGLQTGIKYAINSKILKDLEVDGSIGNYKSEFNSVHVPLLLKYKFTTISKLYSKPLSINLLTGLDYSFLDRKNIHQIGVVAGAEYDIFTQADLMFTLGLRGGLYNNLNLNEVTIPEKINKYNYNFSAYISLRFIDWAKKEK